MLINYYYVVWKKNNVFILFQLCSDPLFNISLPLTNIKCLKNPNPDNMDVILSTGHFSAVYLHQEGEVRISVVQSYKVLNIIFPQSVFIFIYHKKVTSKSIIFFNRNMSLKRKDVPEEKNTMVKHDMANTWQAIHNMCRSCSTMVLFLMGYDTYIQVDDFSYKTEIHNLSIT